MAAERIVGTIAGTVTCTNGHGFRLGEEWVNISRYAHPAPELPPVGAQVECGVDKSGYVHSITVVSRAASDAPASGTSDAPDRETRITRMASINAAIELLKTGVAKSGPLSVDAVLATAERLEGWVNR